MDGINFFNTPFEIDGNYQAQPTLGSAPDQDSKNYITDVFSGMPTIPETTYGLFQSAPYGSRPPMGSPFSYSSQSSGHRTSSTFSSSMSPASDQFNLTFGNSQPARSLSRKSLLTTKLEAQPQMNFNDHIMSQPVSPMVTSPILTNSPHLLGTPESFTQFSPLYAHFQPSPNGYYPDKDPVASHQLDTQLIAMAQDPVSPMGDWFPSSTEMVPHHSKAIPINKRTARHPSISGCSRSPYSRGDPMTFSPTSEISSSLMGGSFTTTPSMVAGFSQEQLPAAQAILQFIADRSNEPIPSHLINDQLADITNGHGYCMIGNCAIKRAMQKCNPESDASKETLKKRADHLYDHIRDKHFNCRPFQCIQCPRAFSRDHDLKRHEAVHNPTPYLCHTCLRSYTREDNLKRHIGSKHPEVIAAQAMQQSSRLG